MTGTLLIHSLNVATEGSLTLYTCPMWYNLPMKNERNHGTSTPEMVTISRAEYASLKAERDELNQKLDWLLEQVRLNRKKLYGVSSERLEEELIGPS